MLIDIVTAILCEYYTRSACFFFFFSFSNFCFLYFVAWFSFIFIYNFRNKTIGH